MADIDMGPISGISGQAGKAPDAGSAGDGTTGQAPAPDRGQTQDSHKGDGQAASTDGPGTGQRTGAPTRPGATPDPSAEETFFDPKTLDPSLLPAYKQMQSAFSKKMAGLSSHRQKVEAYDAFERDPHGTFQSLARQLGYEVTPRGHAPTNQGPGNAPAPPVGQQPGPQAFVPEGYEPTSWNEVYGRAVQFAVPAVMEAVMARLGPVIAPLSKSVEQITSNNIENALTEIDGNWRIYEDEIKATLREHPTLLRSQDGIRKLYRLSVPEEVYTSRAVQEAMRKQQAKVDLARQGSKTTVQHTSRPSNKRLTFAEAIDAAKEELASAGRG